MVHHRSLSRAAEPPWHYYVRRSNVAVMPRRSASSKGGLGRSNEPPVLILTSLAGGPKHGYALTKDIEQFAGVTLGPGTLYGAITRLEERGLIEPEAVGSDERRRPYRITGTGTGGPRGGGARHAATGRRGCAAARHRANVPAIGLLS